MRYFLTLSIFCFLLIFVFLGNSYACSVDDNCKPIPCAGIKDYFGAYSPEAVKNNLDYYDLILVADKPFVEDKYDTSLRVISIFKNKTDASPNEYNEFMFDARKDGEKRVANRTLPNGEIATFDACYDKFYGFSKEGPYLIFAQQDDKYGNPLIVRMTSIPEHEYHPDNVKSKEADIIISAVLRDTKKVNAKVYKTGATSPFYSLDSYHVIKVLKSSGVKIDKNLTLKIRKHLHSLGRERYYYPHEQPLLIYLKEDEGLEGFYNVKHVSFDVDREINLLKLQSE